MQTTTSRLTKSNPQLSALLMTTTTTANDILGSSYDPYSATSLQSKKIEHAEDRLNDIILPSLQNPSRNSKGLGIFSSTISEPSTIVRREKPMRLKENDRMSTHRGH